MEFYCFLIEICFQRNLLKIFFFIHGFCASFFLIFKRSKWSPVIDWPATSCQPAKLKEYCRKCMKIFKICMLLLVGSLQVVGVLIYDVLCCVVVVHAASRTLCMRVKKNTREQKANNNNKYIVCDAQISIYLNCAHVQAFNFNNWSIWWMPDGYDLCIINSYVYVCCNETDLKSIWT